MKYFFFQILLFIVGCSTDTSKKVTEVPIQLKTSNQQLKLNFDSCLRLTQQLIKKQISDKEFSEYFSLDRKATGFEYDNVVFHITDTLSQLPKRYQIFYDFLFKGDTLGSFRADFDSTVKVIYDRNFHLIAFRQFIDKELPITKTKATEIALKNGLKGQGLEVILNCSSDKFYWDCKNYCNGCLYLDIDARTGNIIRQGKVVYRY